MNGNRIFIFAACLVAAAISARAQEPPEWPRVFDLPQGQVVVYQPQVESFKDGIISARSAVMGKRAENPEPVFGALWVTARADVDRDARLVKLSDRKIERVHFPGANLARVEELKQAIQAKIPRESLTLSLDRLIPMLDAAEKESAKAAQLKNDPPAIVVMSEPAVLVAIDGEPRMAEVPGSKLMRVVNTPFVIAFDPAAKLYYLLAGGTWMTAGQLDWPWAPAAKVPAEVAALAGDVQTAPPEPGAQFPKIVIATRPTELICTTGEPEFTPIHGTGLTYVSNSPNDVFVNLAEGRIYALLSGRWYSAEKRDGPWTYVPSAQLPPDFARIPADSPKASVRASIAGTPEAREAVLDTYVPQTAAILRSTAVIDVEYDGAPQFQPIEDTALKYAANTPSDVIQAGNRYYCCQDAVWYEASSPTGPWTVCVNVPEEIYSIPPSSPVYRTTFVEVYDSTPEEVYVGYTPGYTGTYVADDVVVYGTGYPYAAWLGAAYYARPLTWGFAPRYNPANGIWGARVGWGGGAGWVDPIRAGGGWWGAAGYRDVAWESSVNTRAGEFTKSGQIERTIGGVQGERTLEGPGGRQMSSQGEIQRTYQGVEGERTITGPGGRQVYDQAELRRTSDGVEGERTVTGPGGAQAQRAGEVNRTSDGLEAESRTEGPRGNQVYRDGEVERTSDGLHAEQSATGPGGRYSSKETDVERTSDGFEVNRQAQGPGGGSAGTTTEVSFDDGEMNVERSGWADPAVPPASVYKRNASQAAQAQRGAGAAARGTPTAQTPPARSAQKEQAPPATMTGGHSTSSASAAKPPADAPKDLYADSSGNVYRQSLGGWETQQGGQWTKAGGESGAAEAQRPAGASTAQRPTGGTTSELNQQHQARARGDQRTQSQQQQRASSQRSSSAARPSGAQTRSAPSRSAPSRSQPARSQPSRGGGGGRGGR